MMAERRLNTLRNAIGCWMARYLSMLMTVMVNTLAPTETPANRDKCNVFSFIFIALMRVATPAKDNANFFATKHSGGAERRPT
jgi:hypothetical protein